MPEQTPQPSTQDRLTAAAGLIDTACREIRQAIAAEAAADGTPESIGQLTEHLRQAEARVKALRAGAIAPLKPAQPLRTIGTRTPTATPAPTPPVVQPATPPAQQ